MWIIQELSEMALEECEGADHYISRALELREKYPKLADLLHKLSAEEMQHVSALQDMAQAMIEEYKKDKGEPPADILAVHNYIHRKQLECEAQIKAKQSLYK